jgi:hypothetical protein
MATELRRRSSAGDGHELHGHELQDKWPVLATKLQRRSSAGDGHELQQDEWPVMTTELQRGVRPVMATSFKGKFGR